MATLTANQQLTLVELAKRTANKKIETIAERLSEVNEMMMDAVWIEANDLTSHVTTVRTSLPSGTYRKINSGVASEASTTKQIREDIAMLEAFSKVDKKLVDIAPDKAAFRSGEDMAFVEGIGQSMMDALIYGNKATDPEQINGLATRYNALADTNVVGAGGTGSDVSSIWIIQWGMDKAHLIYPKGGMPGGINFEDMGIDVAQDGSSNDYVVYRSHFEVNFGLVVRDDRNVQRIANIETSGSSNIFDEDLLIRRLRNMTNGGKGAVIYANQTILSQMDVAAKDKTNVNYYIENVFGVPTTTFRGFPVRQVDAILDTETAIS